jgi:hypothetical protein
MDFEITTIALDQLDFSYLFFGTLSALCLITFILLPVNNEYPIYIHNFLVAVFSVFWAYLIVVYFLLRYELDGD